MPYERPNLSTLRTQVANDINGNVDGVDARLRFSNLGIMGVVLAGLADGLYGYLDYIAKQSSPFTATDEYLEAWAGLKGVTRKPAAKAAGSIAFPAVNGKVVPAGVVITRTDGVSYVSSASATAASNSVSVPAVAVEAGAAGNASEGTTFLLGVGIAGVTATGAAAADVVGGVDVESDDSLRSRMLLAYAKQPQGGSIPDYGEWSLEVPGVTRVWVQPGAMGPGTIIIYFMMDDAEAVHGGFPQGTDGCATQETRDTTAVGDQLALADHLFLKQPPTALVYAVAPTANTLAFTIAGIASADSATKTAIEGAIAAALKRDAYPGGLTAILPVQAAMATIAGSEGAVITNITCSAGSVSPGTDGNITSNAGALPVFGSAAFV